MYLVALTFFPGRAVLQWKTRMGNHVRREAASYWIGSDA
jgi:hypothetical protein